MFPETTPDFLVNSAKLFSNPVFHLPSILFEQAGEKEKAVAGKKLIIMLLHYFYIRAKVFIQNNSFFYIC